MNLKDAIAHRIKDLCAERNLNPRACLKIAFGKLCAPLCGRCVVLRGTGQGLVDSLGQIAGMNFQTRSSSLAYLCGMDRSTIYSILGNKSKNPEIAAIKKICDGLEITLGTFFNSPLFDSLDQEIK